MIPKVPISPVLNAFLVTPNLGELRAPRDARSWPEIWKLRARAHGSYGIAISLSPSFDAWRSSSGENDSPGAHTAREVYDVTGAGDNGHSRLSRGGCGGRGLEDACFVAIIAAGVWWASIRPPPRPRRGSWVCVRQSYRQDRGPGRTSRNVGLFVRREAHRVHQRMFRPSPCRPHTYLNEARGLGDVLIVGLNTDRSIRALKANRGPSFRSGNGAMCSPRWKRRYVVPSTRTLRWTSSEPYGRYSGEGLGLHEGQSGRADIVDSYGGRCIFIRLVDNTSTTDHPQDQRESC